ncbi:secondary thiamine-phosphate synthase enzyme YjbQ [Natranaerobius thermophilus]|uniref:Secondary thiamine-phosphate synthase enzyme n=1 Tax=Natranaerobius thermophilus (strain ATCC BAA-1301 / DSM 18059 / JW/NM-WN-LF) TaxID=457570 RepID=B2A200_NATTJ|nr:secondary thiamine-phosphate synthase enzyme YjbQ [Natranaerobius thermophilus]ACB84805.1 protein of unknown function UPF0047 [Natranaerobius thermophilus JW/NM-WN-LF]
MEITVTTSKKIEFINITEEVKKALSQMELPQGNNKVHLFIPHTTAAITVNETADPDVCFDLENACQKIIPDISYQHLEGNSPAHFLSSLVGPDIMVPIRKNTLDLGRWQGIIFCEFDGPRRRKVKILY